MNATTAHLLGFAARTMLTDAVKLVGLAPPGDVAAANAVLAHVDQVISHGRLLQAAATADGQADQWFDGWELGRTTVRRPPPPAAGPEPGPELRD